MGKNTQADAAATAAAACWMQRTYLSQVSPTTTTPTLTPTPRQRQSQRRQTDGGGNLAPVFISFSSPVALLEPVSVHIFFCFCVCIFFFSRLLHFFAVVMILVVTFVFTIRSTHIHFYARVSVLACVYICVCVCACLSIWLSSFAVFCLFLIPVLRSLPLLTLAPLSLPPSLSSSSLLLLYR